MPVLRSTGRSLTFRLPSASKETSYTLTFDSGYREQYFTANTLGNQGFSKYYQALATVTHQLRERLSVGLTGSSDPG